MEQQISIAAVEQACQELQSPDDAARRRALLFLEQVRALRNPYALCAQILQSSHSPLALFESISLIRGAALRYRISHAVC